MKVGRDLNPFVQLALNFMVDIVKSHFSSFKKGRLPVLVELGLLELVEEVILDCAKWFVISLPVVCLKLFFVFAVSVRRAILRVSSVFIDLIVSDPPELSTVFKLLIIWLILIFDRVSEEFVPKLFFLFFRLVVGGKVIHITLPSSLLFLFVLLLVLLVLLVMMTRLLFLLILAPVELNIEVKLPLRWVFIGEILGVVFNDVVRLCNSCKHSIVF